MPTHPNRYVIGARVTITGVFASDDTPADPTAVVASALSPSGDTSELTYGVDAALRKNSTGSYSFDIDVTEAGYWWYRLEGTGAVVAAEEGQFVVRTSKF